MLQKKNVYHPVKLWQVYAALIKRLVYWWLSYRLHQKLKDRILRSPTSLDENENFEIADNTHIQKLKCHCPVYELDELMIFIVCVSF